MSRPPFTPATAAIQLSHWLDAFSQATGSDRFPVDVKELALAVGKQLNWPDPIYKVEPANIPGFEGGLFHIDGKGWALLYDQELKSKERIRFTLAHELGHYLVHRDLHQDLECSKGDMVHWGVGQKDLEHDADEFAANLFMPMNHFRQATSVSPMDFEVLSEVSANFGVSLTSAALRWINSTEESAVLVMAHDGFMEWSVSSDRAQRNGAFFRTKGKVVEVLAGTVAADDSVASARTGERRSLKTWFVHAHVDALMQEMKLLCNNYGYMLSLLRLSPGDKVWDAETDFLRAIPR